MLNTFSPSLSTEVYFELCKLILVSLFFFSHFLPIVCLYFKLWVYSCFIGNMKLSIWGLTVRDAGGPSLRLCKQLILLLPLQESGGGLFVPSNLQGVKQFKCIYEGDLW